MLNVAFLAATLSACDRLSPLMMDPNHSERRAVALIVDAERFQWPAVNHITVFQNVARPQDRLNRQPLDQAKPRSLRVFVPQQSSLRPDR
jgi:hypothetical protein